MKNEIEIKKYAYEILRDSQSGGKRKEELIKQKTEMFGKSQPKTVRSKVSNRIWGWLLLYFPDFEIDDPEGG